MTQPPNHDLAKRIQVLEDQLEIQQLAVRYAIAVDARDIDELLRLFVPDVRVGRGRSGRDELRVILEPQLRLFYRSIHLICGHRVILQDEDRAIGNVYCRAEHEVDQRWIVIPVRYDDEYRKVNGAWHFSARRDHHWYEADVLDRPQSVAFHDWQSAPPRPSLPESSPKWEAFWHGVDTSGLTTQPVIGEAKDH